MVVVVLFGIICLIILFGADKGSFELMNSKAGLTSSKVVYPDTSRMVIYDPRQTNGTLIIISS